MMTINMNSSFAHTLSSLESLSLKSLKTDSVMAREDSSNTLELKQNTLTSGGLKLGSPVGKTDSMMTGEDSLHTLTTGGLKLGNPLGLNTLSAAVSKQSRLVQSTPMPPPLKKSNPAQSTVRPHSTTKKPEPNYG